MSFPALLLDLLVIFAAAKLLGHLAQRVGQPAVLGELLAGVLLGVSVLGLVDPKQETLHLLAELGVLILLFEIGLESDLDDLLEVGWQALLVALVGIAVPFALGYAAMLLLGEGGIRAVFVGATLTATSIGITARVLADLGRMDTAAARIILGAAVVDDILGLVILSVVQGLATTGEVSLAGIATTAALALGFLAVAVVVGRLAAPRLLRAVRALDVRGGLLLAALGLAMLFALLAHAAGSATIVGAFAAGLVLAETEDRHPIEERVRPLADFFVPLFFVTIGAAVDIRVLDPFDPARRATLAVAALLIVAAVAGKLASGLAVKPVEPRERLAVGVGMVPRGEVGLVFASVGLSAGVVGEELYAAVVAMVIVTTFMTPPLLKAIFAPAPAAPR
ncbi:MAG TPA: cation:proton antiporter [Thermodesulfobacteriota bacterium]|nr:cation:proton antiporter [Thermodesulfobacteriota bacterium]